MCVCFSQLTEKKLSNYFQDLRDAIDNRELELHQNLSKKFEKCCKIVNFESSEIDEMISKMKKSEIRVEDMIIQSAFVDADKSNDIFQKQAAKKRQKILEKSVEKVCFFWWNF